VAVSGARHDVPVDRSGGTSTEISDVDRSDWILGVILPAAIHLAFVATAVCYFLGVAAAPTLFAISLLCLLVIALRRAWEMLLWIATKID